MRLRPRGVLAVCALVGLHALSREVDRALGLLLRAELPPDGLLRELARAVAAEGLAAPARVAAWVLAGVCVSVLLAAARARAEQPAGGRRTLAAALDAEVSRLTPLLLRPFLTLLALSALALRPEYPYGFTLPVALTQDWHLAQDLAALAALVALHAPSVRIPAPRAGEVFLLGFLAYALLAPGWAWRWEGHPGNEPKYLRQAVALGHGLTFDAEGVSAAMEKLPTRPFGAALRDAASTGQREAGRLASALARGEAGRDAIRATRITRQTIRGKDGGVYYVLAPGPSLLLAPALRLDRALNLARSTEGRLAVSVLLWCGFAAGLVSALFALLRDTTGRPGLSALLACGFGLVPPFLFYFFQFYPELLGALVLTLVCAELVRRRGSAAVGAEPEADSGPRPERLLERPWLFGLLAATLPWLHQKFLPVWAALAVTAGVLAVRRLGMSRRLVPVLLAIVVPQALSLGLTALYNFAITGSARPDALFLAWGPAGISSARVGQGLLGLLLDARYGILPYVPLFALALAGALDARARALAPWLPAALAYYLTVASADNWAGAVCNLGRYVMPIAPLAVVLVGLALSAGAPRRLSRGAVALALVLAAWAALFALSLWRDPLAANDSGLLLAKSTYADGHQYVPDLFLRHWSDGAPGLAARVVAWLVALGLVAGALRRVRSPQGVLAGLALALLALGFALERWPTSRASPAFANALAAGPGSRLFLGGAVRVREDEALVGPGRVDVLLRRDGERGEHADPPSLHLVVGGSGVLQMPGRPPLVLRPSGAVVELPLLAYHVVGGRDGRAAFFSRSSVALSGQAVWRFSDEGLPVRAPTAGSLPPVSADGAVSDDEGEPGAPGLR